MIVHAATAVSTTATPPEVQGTALRRRWQPSVKMFALERSVNDFWPRWCSSGSRPVPNLRFASVENGSSFVPGFAHGLSSTAKKVAGWFREDRWRLQGHVWINPFWEDDVHALVETMGADGSSSAPTGAHGGPGAAWTYWSR